MTERKRTRDVPYRPPRETPRNPATVSLLLSFVRRYISPLKRKIIPYIVITTLNACSTYLIAWYGKVAVDDILHVRVNAGAGEAAIAPAPDASLRLALLFAVYVATIIVLNRIVYFSFYARHDFGRLLTIRLRDDLHRCIRKLSTIYHLSVSPGRLMARILNDVDAVREYIIVDFIHDLVPQCTMLIVGFAILLSISPVCAGVVALSMVPYSLALKKRKNKLNTANREIRHSNACLWGLASQKFDSMRAVAAYGRERSEATNFFRLSAVMLRDIVDKQRINAALNSMAQLICAFTTYGLLVYCTHLVLHGRMTLGQMLYVNGAVVTLFAPITILTDMSVKLSDILVLVGRIDNTLTNPEFVPEPENPRDMPVPLREGMAFRNVSFRYHPSSPDVLHRISVTFRAGETIAVMGPSGAGKSTFIGLLARLWVPTSGEIDFDGVPLGDISHDSLRRSLALAPQEAQIFYGSIRENIAYGRDAATDEQIWTAAREADADAFIHALPRGLETIIGENGATLSGGQRQRVSLARALLADPQVLLLDDVTSALDAATERRIQDTLARLMRGRTSIVATQRVSMALRCDKVLVLENGCVTAFGAPSELRRRTGTFFARLCEEQLAGLAAE